jgi:hypothetical protein
VEALGLGSGRADGAARLGVTACGERWVVALDAADRRTGGGHPQSPG